MAMPSGYKRLEYIQSTGTQYIDAGFKPNQYTNMEVKFSTSAGTGMGAVAATQDKLGTNGYGVDISACVYADLYIVSYRFAKDVEHIAKIIDGVFYDNGVQVWSNSGKVFSSNYNLTICGYMSGGVVSQYYTGRIYYLKIWQSGILFRDYIPCQTTSGEVGLWDDVNSVFYGNSGTGTFTAGPVVAIAAAASEITELEYIQSSGTQYVDTEFKPNQNTKFVVDVKITNRQCHVFGARTSWQNKAFCFYWATNNDGCVQLANSNFNGGSFDESARHKITMTASELYIDDTLNKTYSVGSFQCEKNAWLMSCYSSSAAEYAKGNLYSAKIYDNEVIIRDYIAAKLSDGTVGLYDKLNGLLYINMGTGEFTSGPEVPKAPQAPTGFSAYVLTDTTVRLSWTASDGATGYNLYKAGDLIATLEETSYIDTVELFSGNTYSVTAFNDDGESKAATLVHYSVPENPILYLVTDRTAEDVTAQNTKGTYRSGDLNRVGYAVRYLADLLASHGTIVNVTPKMDWTDFDHPTPKTMATYLSDVETLRSAMTLPEDTASVPSDMAKLTWQEANAIETILTVLDDMLRKMMSIVDAGWTAGLAYTGFYFKEAGK